MSIFDRREAGYAVNHGYTYYSGITMLNMARCYDGYSRRKFRESLNDAKGGF